MTIHESAEDYLEAILRLQLEKGYARSVDVAMLLNVSKPSVSVAMKRLREDGYITMDDDHLLELTETGRSIAEPIYERHTTLASFFSGLGVDEEIARQDACKIEHDLSEETYQAIKRMIQKNRQK